MLPGKLEPKSEYRAIAEQWARARRDRGVDDGGALAATVTATADVQARRVQQQRETLNQRRRRAFDRRWRWTVAFWVWLLTMHAGAIWLFTSGFLLTRLVLDDRSQCAQPPVDSPLAPRRVDAGCWHTKTFDRAVVVIIDALRYDFTVPVPAAGGERRHFLNAFPFLYETAVAAPQNAFLRPFIADPPTTTLQRLKGLTTGTLPTFIDAGSNFAGTAIDEDNLLLQLRRSGKKVVHLGDDTWTALFPGHFEANLSRAYDSFNVWDLHTVDNGVIDHIMPLLEPGTAKGLWDVLIGHCLGVDHAGHRYGPDHPAMRAKLQQMDGFVRKLAGAIDDDMLLVIMGDHGMDTKGDHGGESDNEVQAALWMYAKRPIFGRTAPEHATPPATAKTRPVDQIDLVPTLALLLGIPIPFNSLGRPIEEAFAGRQGSDWVSLAAVTRMASAGIRRYQSSYFIARGLAQDDGLDSPAQLWTQANADGLSPRDAYQASVRFQEETLRLCRRLWARFDVPRMMAGVALAAAGVALLLTYSSRSSDEAMVVSFDMDLDDAEQRLELASVDSDGDGQQPHADQSYHRDLLCGLWDWRFLSATGALVLTAAVYGGQPLDGLAGLALVPMTVRVGAALCRGRSLRSLLPRDFWGWMAAAFSVGRPLGFASNSYTVWEDSVLLFLLTTFGVAAAAASFRIACKADRAMAIYHALTFAALGRLASYSTLCREEQMPYCRSTYYASAASSTSAPWQLAVPFVIFAVLPPVIKSFLEPTRSYEGPALVWMGYVFRASLLVSAIYWVVDAADNGGWLGDRVAAGALKTASVYLAQTGLALALVAGMTAFVWAPPSVSMAPAPASAAGRRRVVIRGYANAAGARYLMLPLNVLAACLLLSKPMGAGALALMLWQVLSLVEVLDLNGLQAAPIGPVVLAMLGNFHFFRTGHQAVLSSIQWDSAFVALSRLRYPWTPLVVALNTFAGQAVAAASVPLLTLWKTNPRQRGVLERTARAAGVFVAYFAVEALVTMACAGWLRRHLMLYRVFSPRFMMAVTLLLVLDLVVLAVALTGLRANTLSVGELFGWPE